MEFGHELTMGQTVESFAEINCNWSNKIPIIKGSFPVLNHSQECGLTTVSFTKSWQKFREYFFQIMKKSGLHDSFQTL